jgi:anti-sigma B factor antagonist
VSQFAVHTVNRDRRAIVSISGRIDTSTSGEFRDALRAAQDSSGDVIIDFADVTFTDASGIDILIEAHKSVVSPSRLRGVGAPPSIRRVFEFTGIADLLVDEPSEPTKMS